MIGPGLKKLAQQNGMSISSGIAYGDFRGYATTFSEGSGFKRVSVTTKFPDEQSINSLVGELHRRDIRKEFRVQELTVSENRIDVEFYDNIGTMKCINAFFDFFYPLLTQYGAAGTGFCPECGGELLGSGCWKFINGAAYHLHESCAESVISAAEVQEQIDRETDNGSIVSGIVGALLGALVGAIPWAFLLYQGYFAAIVGLLIGWLSKKGYELFRGRKSRAKLYIVIIASIIGVLVGNVAADYYAVFALINDGSITGLAYGDILPYLMYLFSVDEEFLRLTLIDAGEGILFALLGTYGIFREIRKETAGNKFKDLK